MPDHEFTEDMLPAVLDRFYARVRADALIGPVFNDAVHDWSDHLERIGAFWSSVMLGTGRYKGNPVAKHFAHADRLTPERFARWLEIWALTTTEMLPASVAAEMQVKAARIAESLQLAIEFASAAQRSTMEASELKDVAGARQD